MFSIFKQASSEVALKELSEGQLAEVAGGYDHDKHLHHKVKHHHHHHQHHLVHKWVKKSHSHSHSHKPAVHAHW